MNILILGGGGREHALAWAVKQNPKCDRLIVAPGNAGIAMVAECADLDILDGAAVVTFAEGNAVDFVIVGPEAPLAAGVADALRAAGEAVFGPSAAAARLEASKAFTKEICDACGAPTAGYARFTDRAAAEDYVTVEYVQGLYDEMLEAAKVLDFERAQALRDELRGTGVDVRALCPPPGDTPMLRSHKCDTSSRMSPTAIGSMPAKGSSKRIKLGLEASARAISHRRRSPPDRRSEG